MPELIDVARPHAGTPPPTSPLAAGASWRDDGAAWVLSIAGDWQGSKQGLPDPPPALRAGHVKVDASALGNWDARLASALWQCLTALDSRHVTIDLERMPRGLQHILRQALPPPPPPPPPPPSAGAAGDDTHQRPPQRAWPVGSGRIGRGVESLGARAAISAARLRATLALVGELVLSLGRLLRGRSHMRWADFAWQFEQTGPRSVPIVALVSALVGLIVTYMGAAQLQRFGAQTFIADLVTLGVVREIAALLVGIVLAGRVGAAFAAQIGSMRANEEIDALSTLGVNTIDHLVLPRVLALVLVGPMLTVFAAVVGLVMAGAVAVTLHGVGPIAFVHGSVQAMTLPHVLVGLFKGTVYALLVALAGCRQGLAAGRSAQAVGEATTTAVVQSIVWTVVAASVLTVLFQRLGW
jgi:phospholipid/cholesterol/gamma-HCH transport system permease protein